MACKQAIAFDPFVPDAVLEELDVRSVSLEELLTTADFVSVHCPLNEQTRGLIGANEIARMKPEAYLLNTARGGIVDEQALFDALRERRIAGAALDCFEEEPVTRPHRFGELETVILAPHSIAWTTELFRDIGRTACQSMLDLSQGKRPRGVLNPELFERASFRAKWARDYRHSWGVTWMSLRLTGQVAWISGGASGIGEATSRLFAAEGAAVVIADVADANAKRVADEINSSGGSAVYTPCDVSDSDRVARSINTAVERFGGLQIVVNCAGIVHIGPLHECSEADWDRIMGVNLKSVFFSLKHAFSHLCQNDRSYMVNVGSISSHVGQRLTPAYTTSKGAVLSLTQSIALDYAASGLRCNCVCPGITDTPMLRRHLNTTRDPDETLRRRVRRVPLNRAIQPAEVARTILYLSCEDSAGVNGTSLVVDGGYLAAAEWDTADDPVEPGDNA